MKTKLLTALLMLATIPFFAAKTSIEQKTTVELLELLKATKIQIYNNTCRKQSEEELKKLETKYGSQLYQETTNICHELYTFMSKTTSTICCLNYTYKEFQDLAEYTDAELSWYLYGNCPCISLSLINLIDERGILPNLEPLIKSIFIKYGKDISKSALELLSDFFSAENTSELSVFIDITRHINIVLSKIDAKITELEAQLYNHQK
jgi:hypothetical protein